jgi:hypothetical protein
MKFLLAVLLIGLGATSVMIAVNAGKPSGYHYVDSMTDILRR